MKKRYLWEIIAVCIIIILGIGHVFMNNKIMQNKPNEQENISQEQVNENPNQNTEQYENCVVIKNGVIKNENLIDEFLSANNNAKLEIIQDDDKIVVESIAPGYFRDINEKAEDDVIYIGDGSDESNKKYYGYYKVTINESVSKEYTKFNHIIKRRLDNNNNVNLYFEAHLIEYAEDTIICTYSLESSNYTQKFELEYIGRKDLGIKEVYDAGDFKVKTFAGDVHIIIEQDMVYKLEDALNTGVITTNDILEQAKMDAKYGFCTSGYYSDGGSTEYCYYKNESNQYTILKLNTLAGDKDLVIGYKGGIINTYNKYKRGMEHK